MRHDRGGFPVRRAVPVKFAFKACDIISTRSFVGSYGHDDRVCSYTAATALLDLKATPAHTCVCLLVDKETGSDA